MAAPFSINSTVDGIAWPGIPAPNGASLLAVLFQLEQTQWWEPEELLRAQREQLKALLAHARAHVPFYRERLHHFRGLFDAESWLETWRQIPPLSRAEMQAADADDAMATETLPPGHGELREIYTSGSTGKPVRSVRTQLWELMWSAFTVRDHLWHRRDFRGTFATLRESGKGKALYPDGVRAESWGYSSATILRTGPLVSLNTTTALDQQLEWLKRQNPDYLLTHPTIAQRLAAGCRESDLRLPRLKQVITISENLRPEVRTLVREAWGVPVVDIYSTREMGYIALQCPDHDHYHVQSEHVFVEILNEDGRPCRPGEVGKLLVTSLHNLAMPLIRYDIGDCVEVGAPCSCGRGLPVINRILGRTQNMLVMPWGERRWPLLSSADIQAMLDLAPAIRQYQFVQKAPDVIQLRLTVSQVLTYDEEARLADWIRDKFAAPFRVIFAYFDELPRTAAGKFDEFISELA